MPPSRVDRFALSVRTWLLGPVLAAACTAPPRPRADAPPPPPPAEIVLVAVAAPGLSAEAVEAQIVAPLEDALAGVPQVRALASRAAPDLAQIAVTLTGPDALDVTRAAVARATLPPETEAPTLLRGGPDAPAAVLVVPTGGDLPSALVDAVQRRAGVGRVVPCGGGEPLGQIDLDLDRVAALGLGVDLVLGSVELSLLDLYDSVRPPAVLEDMPDVAVGTSDIKLRDIAVIRRTVSPRACADPRDPSALVLAVVPQQGADPQQAADAARSVASELSSPIRAFPAAGDLLATFALELAPSAPPTVAECLRRVPAVRDHALVSERAAPDRATLHVAAAPEPPAPPTAGQITPPPTFPIEPVREALSSCTGVIRVAAVAPLAQADVALTIEVLGPDPAALPDLAARAAALAREQAAVTLVRPFAGELKSELELRIDRQAAATAGVAVSALARAARLAIGPVDIGALRGLPIRVDAPARPAPADPRLGQLRVSSARGPVPLSGLVTLVIGPPALTARHRVDRRPAALVELRLRRAADRDALAAALGGLARPPGVDVRLGPALALRSL